MAVAQGTCPSCGAPIEFGVGASIAKVCDYCRATIVRGDSGFQNYGKIADLAHTPSLIAVGDQGTLAGRPFEVLGRVQLDHGAGPWDEYYVAFDHGQAWGWLAYAEGHWYVTSHLQGQPAPRFDQLRLEGDVDLGAAGSFRVFEIKTGKIVSAEGELPALFQPGQARHYADLLGRNLAFATLDYGDRSGGATVFTGWVFAEPQMQVTQAGPRTIHKVKAEQIKCPSCGGEVPALSGDRAERLGCPYCGAVSDIALQQVVAKQEALRKLPDIPVGSRGTFNGVEYVCIAYMRRGSDFDGEHFSWEEYLIWSQPVGFRWLVKDPESGWSWVTPANLADVDLRGLPEQVAWGGKLFNLRNNNVARVEYVFGEVYWKCEVGEATEVSDFTAGKEVLSRELSASEVKWSHSAPIAWPVIAAGFGLPVDGPGGKFGGGGSQGGASGCAQAGGLLFIIIVILLICAVGVLDDSGGSSSYRGGTGIFVGGK